LNKKKNQKKLSVVADTAKELELHELPYSIMLGLWHKLAFLENIIYKKLDNIVLHSTHIYHSHLFMTSYGETATATGKSPTFIVFVTALVEVSITETELPCDELTTYNVDPSGDSATALGSFPTQIERVTVLVAISINKYIV